MTKPSSSPTFQAVADAVGITLCTDCTTYDGQRNHTQGFVTIPPNLLNPIVHWRERQVRIGGLVTFLKLVAQATSADARSGPEWRQLWARHVIARDLAKLIHRHIPRQATMADRATCRYYLSRITSDVVRWDYDAELRAQHRKALAWVD